ESGPRPQQRRRAGINGRARRSLVGRPDRHLRLRHRLRAGLRQQAQPAEGLRRRRSGRRTGADPVRR
ncbi:MAG: hypothetical protein AVDCRST_MAG32-2437, partial [uncultured Nocardioides sp.]